MRTKLQENLIKNKREALRFFTKQLLNSEAKDLIAKIILFGSLANNKGSVKKESDIDIYIVALDNLDQVAKRCDQASLETALQYDESVEPIIGSIEKFKDGKSYFLRQVLENQEEVYTVPEEEMQKGEAQNYLSIATEYLDSSRSNLKLENYRLIIDGAYNAAELAAKGLLILEGEEIPKRHGSVIRVFSKIYIKPEKLPREIGRSFNQALRLRNQARYEYHATITEKQAKDILNLAEKLVKALEDHLSEE